MSENLNFVQQNPGLVQADLFTSPTVEELYNLYYSKLFRIAYNFFQSSDRAADIVQDFFLRFCEKDKIRQYDPTQGPIDHWLNRSMSNFCIDMQRLAYRRIGENASGELLVNSISTTADPFRRLLGKENFLIVSQVLGEMPPNLATVIRMARLEELSQEEISQRLKLPIGTVKSRIHRGEEILTAGIRFHFRPRRLRSKGSNKFRKYIRTRKYKISVSRDSSEYRIRLLSADELEQVIAQLPPRMAELARLFYLEKKRPSYKQIATIIGVKRNTVASYSTRVKSRMLKILSSSRLQVHAHKEKALKKKVKTGFNPSWKHRNDLERLLTNLAPEQIENVVRKLTPKAQQLARIYLLVDKAKRPKLIELTEELGYSYTLLSSNLTNCRRRMVQLINRWYPVDSTNQLGTT
jgi:RNA polymerase sigma factor (sigma-70 family)